MASFSDKITVIIDVATEKATRGMKDFKSSVKEAEGFTGKLKAGVGSLGAQFKSAATSPAGMAAGVAAMGAGALKAVDEFAQLGLEVGKFSDATGLAAEDASRWIEVAGDIGIEAGSVQTAIGRLNKSIDPEKFRELGIEIAKTADGATDVNGTFLNVIDRLNAIKDPAEKARVASKLLGKGWQEMAELIGKGSGALSKSLAEVSDAKVIDADEVRKARDYRAAVDRLQDVFQDLVLTVGQELTPALADAADALGQVGESAGPVLGFLSKIGALKSPIALVVDELDQLGLSAIGSGGDLEEAKRAIEEAETATTKFTGALDANAYVAGLVSKHDAALADDAAAVAEAQEDAEDATRKLSDAYDELIGRIDAEEAWRDLSVAMWELRDGLGDTADEAWDVQKKMADMVMEMDNIPTEKKTKLLTMIDRGALDEVYAELGKLQNTTIRIPVKPVGSGLSTIGGGGKRASGGQVQAGVPYTVGEQGTEMFVPNTNGVVVPHGALNAGGGGGVTYNVRIDGSGLTGDEIVAALKRWERRNGTGWRT